MQSGKFQPSSSWLLVSLPLVLVLCQIVSANHIPSGAESYSSGPGAAAAATHGHYDPYSYGYDVEDNYGNKQWKQERSVHPHEVHGSYGYRDKNGVYREVTYVADKNGFRANIKTNEPGVKGTRDPASTNIESYYSAPPPPPPPQASAVSHSYSHSSPPVYTTRHQPHMSSSSSSSSSYYQN